MYYFNYTLKLIRDQQKDKLFEVFSQILYNKKIFKECIMFSQFSINILTKNGAKELLDLLKNRNCTDKESIEVIKESFKNINKIPQEDEDIQLSNQAIQKLNTIEIIKHFNKSPLLIKEYVAKYRGIFDAHLTEKQFSEEVARGLKDNQDFLSEYINHLYKIKKEVKEPENIAYLFDSLKGETWKRITKDNPEILNDWNVKFSPNLTFQFNLLQRAALYNKEIYNSIKESYPDMSLYENSPNFLFIYNLQGTDIIKDEIRKIGFPEIYKKFPTNSNINQRRDVIDYLLETKEITEWTNQDAQFVQEFVSSKFYEIWESNKLPSKYQEVYEFLLENSRDSTFLEDSLYFSLSICGSFRNNPTERNKETFLKINERILSHCEKNKVAKINFLELFQIGSPSPEFWMNIGGIADRILNISKIVIQNSQSGVTNLDTNALKDCLTHPLEIMQEKTYQGQVTNMFPVINKIFEKIETETEFSLLVNRHFNTEESNILYLKRNGFSKPIITFDTVYQMFPFIQAIDESSFKNVFSKELPIWRTAKDIVSSNVTKKTEQEILNIILDRLKCTEAIKEIDDVKVASNNIFKIALQVNEEQLIKDGKLKDLLSLTNFKMEEMLCTNEALTFLYHYREKDFSHYGLNKNSSKVLECLSEYFATSFLPELRDSYPNAEFRYENGDTPLHRMVAFAHKISVDEMVSSYPEFNIVMNKSKKIPLDLVISKLKVCKTKDKLDNYGYMFKALMKHPIAVPKEKILKLYNDCHTLDSKIKRYEPNWENILQKNLIDSTMNEVKPGLKKEDFYEEDDNNSNNEWKI